MKLHGMFKVTILDRRKRIKRIYNFDNGIKDAGKDDLLDVGFTGAAATDPWYIGLMDNAGYVSDADSETLATKGWTEFTNYSEGTRQEWDENAAASQKLTTNVAASFTMAGAGTIKGIFLAASSTKGETASLLWSTGLFPTPIVLANTEVLKVEYELEIL